jgi:hypothetical protein
MEFSTSFIKLIGSLLLQRKFSVSGEGEMSTPMVMQAGVPKDCLVPYTFQYIYIYK